MYYLNLSEKGYLLSVATTAMIEGPTLESLEGLDFSGVRMQAYKWDGERLTLDENRLAELEAETQKARKHAEIEALKANLTATDYTVIKIAEGAAAREEYADIIAQRQEWREEINRLEVET